MTIDYRDSISEQIANSRFIGGRFERLVDGEWVEWPVLRLDKLGIEMAKKVMASGRRVER
jgi:hypothetical protein